MSDNGDKPAYPQPVTSDRYQQQRIEGYGGLTKREEFARSAQAAIIGNRKTMQELTAVCIQHSKEDEFYQVVVDHAEALLQALAKAAKKAAE